MIKIIYYIIQFLIRGEKAVTLSSYVGYTSDQREFYRYRVVIVPSPFFDPQVYGTAASMPAFPIREVEGVPLLFGSPRMEWHNTTLVVYADILAATYFLISRYEEIQRRDVRDEHGRFPGRESLPYRAGFIHRPVVEDYGKLLRGWLRQTGVPVDEPEAGIGSVRLTHDVDTPFYCRSFRNLAREAVRHKNFRSAWNMHKGSLEEDPYYTFPRMLAQDNEVREKLGPGRCSSVYFLRTGGRSALDRPHYSLRTGDGASLLSLLLANQAEIGLHSSYDAGKDPSLIRGEKESLEKAAGQTIRYNRHHFLTSREPEDMQWLEGANITDDFTMGYPDMAGFRLGTCRPVRWINPVNRRLSPLILHPLTMMDVTLSEPGYMNLSYEQALAYATGLIGQVKQSGGELTLLWHNNSFATEVLPEGSAAWHKELYTALLNELKNQ